MRSYSAGEARELSGCCPSLGAHSRRTPEIPKLVVYAYGSHLFRRKGNFLVAANLDDVPLAGHYLIELSAVLQFHGHHLISYACLSGSLEVVDKTAWYWN
jgi:hypothetical protein